MTTLFDVTKAAKFCDLAEQRFNALVLSGTSIYSAKIALATRELERRQMALRLMREA
jgi:hypothetical protein